MRLRGCYSNRFRRVSCTPRGTIILVCGAILSAASAGTMPPAGPILALQMAQMPAPMIPDSEAAQGPEPDRSGALPIIHRLGGERAARPKATRDCKGKCLTVSWADSGPLLIAMGKEERKNECTWSKRIIFCPKVHLKAPRQVIAYLRMTVHLDLPEGAEANIAAVVNGEPVNLDSFEGPWPSQDNPDAIRRFNHGLIVELRCPKCCTREIETSLTVVLKRKNRKIPAAIAIEEFEIEIVEMPPSSSSTEDAKPGAAAQKPACQEEEAEPSLPPKKQRAHRPARPAT